MSAPANSMRTPLGRARGHGAAHSGTGHFIAQRVSAIALLILAPWLMVSMALTMPDAQLASAIAYLSAPLNAVGVALFLVAALYHMTIGMQVIIEDYISKHFTRALLLVFTFLLAFAIGAGALFALLQINFGV